MVRVSVRLRASFSVIAVGKSRCHEPDGKPPSRPDGCCLVRDGNSAAMPPIVAAPEFGGVATALSVCLYMSFRLHVSKTNNLNFTKFSIGYMLPAVVVRSSSDNNAVRYVLPFCG